MDSNVRLHTPGPVQLSPLVQRALAAQHPHHRTEAFRTQVRGLKPLLSRFFRTRHPALVLTTTGTGAMEAALASLAQPGQRSLSIVAGKFGNRWAQMSQALGLDARVLAVPWGRAVDPEDVARRLDEDEPHLLLATQVETSTGVLHPIEALADLARGHDTLLVVDAVSALGGHPLEMDRWGVDAVVSGSQKVLALPPGLGLVALGERALARLGTGSIPRFSLDLSRALSSWDEDTFPFTPSVPLIAALAASLEDFLRPGMEERWRQFALLSEVARGAAASMGCDLFPESPASTLTTLVPPGGVPPKAVMETMERIFRIRIAGGQEKLRGKILRLGHMGDYGPGDLLMALAALQGSLRVAGVPAAADLGPWAEMLARAWAPSAPETVAP